MRSTRNPSPHYIALSYHRLSLPFYTCLSSISFVTIPKTICEALAHPGWHQAVTDELSAFCNSRTWELVWLSYESVFTLLFVACECLLQSWT